MNWNKIVAAARKVIYVNEETGEWSWFASILVAALIFPFLFAGVVSLAVIF